MAGGIESAVRGLITLGIGVFILILFLNLSYQEYASTANSLVQRWCVAGTGCVGSGNTISGVVQNFTSNGGGIVNAYGSNLNLAVTALVLIAIVVAIIYAVKDTGLVSGFVG